MNVRGETTGETSRSPEANPPERQNVTKIIYIVYLIAALDVTWMFLQFSVTPVSIYQTCRSRKPRFPCAQWLRRRLRKLSWWIWFIHTRNLFNRRCFLWWHSVSDVLLNGSHAPWNKPDSLCFTNTFRKMRGTSSNFSASLKNTQLAAKLLWPQHTRRPFTFTPYCAQVPIVCVKLAMSSYKLCNNFQRKYTDPFKVKPQHKKHSF